MVASDSGNILRLSISGDGVINVLSSLVPVGINNPYKISFSPDGKWFAVGGNGKVLLYEVAKSPITDDVNSVFIPIQKSINVGYGSIAFSPLVPPYNQSQLMVIGSLNDKAIHVYCCPGSQFPGCLNAGDWNQLISINFGNYINDVSFDSTGHYLTATGSEKCRVYYVKDFLTSFNCDQFYNGIGDGYAITTNPNGDIIFTGGDNHLNPSVNNRWGAFRYRTGQFQW